MRPSRLGAMIAACSAFVSLVAIVFLLFGIGDQRLCTIFAGSALALGAVVSAGTAIVLRHPSVVANERTQDQLRVEAHTDSLTGLRNHRAFHEDLARSLAVAHSRGETVALVLFDLDGLKMVNDKQGHQAGDRMISAMADSLRQTLRSRDVAYRIGGDEFAAILPNENHWGAFRFAQRLRGSLGVVPRFGRLSASAGVSSAQGQTRDELIREADLALIAAKRGKRGALIYTEDLAVREQGYESADRVDRLDLMCTALALASDAAAGWPGHAEAVAELAARTADSMGLPSEHVAKVRRAALLHDVGVLNLPTELLRRSGGLTDAEHNVVRSHPELGARILSGIGLDEEAEWVRCHHEQPDGLGYPSGLARAAIPVEASILRVVDAYEAMTSSRSYRPARSHEDAARELRRGSGTTFAEAAVDALLQLAEPISEDHDSADAAPLKSQKAYSGRS